MEHALGISGGVTIMFVIMVALGIGGIVSLFAALFLPQRWHLPYRVEVFFVLLLVALGVYADYRSTAIYSAYEAPLAPEGQSLKSETAAESSERSFDRSIRVYAFQWGFLFFDESGRASRNAVMVGPDERVLFTLASNDVIHGFNIPVARMTTEFEPDEVRAIWIRSPGKPGKYLIQCLNYCGLGHAQMKAWLVVAEGDHQGEEQEEQPHG